MVIPKSANEQRIIENADVHDFQLSPEDFKSLVLATHIAAKYCIKLCAFNFAQSELKKEELIVSWNPLASPWQPE